jgi:translation elongation factor EF-G
VRVAIEAEALQDMGALAAGLDLLHRADPLAEVTLQPSGEHVLGAAGAGAAASQALFRHKTGVLIVLETF